MISNRFPARREARCLVSAAVAAALTLTLTPSADASVELIAIGSLTGSSAGAYTDLSGLTGTLENGLPANILGGLGSGLAYAGGDTFIGLPDRGPNATAYPAGGPNGNLVDNTTSYIPRLQTMSLSLTQAPSGSLPYTLTPTLTSTTLLYSSTALNYGNVVGSGVPAQNAAGKYYFSGRSDNFAAGLSTNPDNARLDPESVRVSNDGKSVFVSDEYGPYVYQFDRATGERIRTFTLPPKFAIAHPNAQGALEEAPNNTTGRIDNKGMEGLAITPDGKTLVGIMQQNLLQDKKKSLRIVTIDIASGATTHEYDYQLTDGSSVSDIVAINDHEFLVDERDGSGLGNGDSAAVKQIYKITFTGAQDVSGVTGDLSAYQVTKTPFLNVLAALNAAGITSDKVPAKLEGIAFGQDIVENGVTKHTLYVANDNDFLSTYNGVSNPNQFYVFSFTDGDLPGYVAQDISSVPLPGALPLLGSGLAALAALRRRRRAAVA